MINFLIFITIIILIFQFLQSVKNNVLEIGKGLFYVPAMLFVFPAMPFITAYKIRKSKPKTAIFITIIWILVYALTCLIFVIENPNFNIVEWFGYLFGFTLLGIFVLSMAGLIKKAFD